MIQVALEKATAFAAGPALGFSHEGTSFENVQPILFVYIDMTVRILLATGRACKAISPGDAVSSLKRALELNEKSEDSTKGAIIIQTELAAVERLSKHYDEALRYLDQARETTEQVRDYPLSALSGSPKQPSLSVSYFDRSTAKLLLKPRRSSRHKQVSS